MLKKQRGRVAVVGLGYVGLPIAIAFGKHAPVIGFDIDKSKIEELRRGIDRTGEVSADDLKTAQVYYTSEPTDLKSAGFIIVAVLTPSVTAAIPAQNPVLRTVDRGNVSRFGTPPAYQTGGRNGPSPLPI